MADILETVEAFLSRNPEFSATRLGKEAMRDPSLVFAMRGKPDGQKRRRLTPATEEALRTFMADYELRKERGALADDPAGRPHSDATRAAAVAAIAAERAAAAAESALRAANRAAECAREAAERAAEGRPA